MTEFDLGSRRPIALDGAPLLVGQTDRVDVERSAGRALRGLQRSGSDADGLFAFGQEKNRHAIDYRIAVSMGATETAILDPKLAVIARTFEQRQQSRIDQVGRRHSARLVSARLVLRRLMASTRATWIAPRPAPSWI